MNRRTFLAISATSLTGLLIPTTGLLEVPRNLVLNAMGGCSFCRKTQREVRATAGTPDGAVRICSECVGLCLDIVAYNARRTSPAAPPPRRADWREALAESGYTDDEVERLLVGSPHPRRRRDLHCSFCDASQRRVDKLIAGPQVYICDGCVAEGGALLTWSGLA